MGRSVGIRSAQVHTICVVGEGSSHRTRARSGHDHVEPLADDVAILVFVRDEGCEEDAEKGRLCREQIPIRGHALKTAEQMPQARLYAGVMHWQSVFVLARRERQTERWG